MTMQFCKCDISKSIIARDRKLNQMIDNDEKLSGEKLKNNHMILFQLLPLDIAILLVRYLKKYLS